MFYKDVYVYNMNDGLLKSADWMNRIDDHFQISNCCYELQNHFCDDLFIVAIFHDKTRIFFEKVHSKTVFSWILQLLD